MDRISRKAMIALCAVTMATTGACQPRSDLELLDSTWQLVADRHYDPELHGLDWPGLRDEYRALIASSGSRAESLEMIDRMLQELGDSHCIVGELVDAAKVSSPYLFGAGDPGIDVRLFEDRVLVTRVASGSSAAGVGISPGFLLTEIDGVPVDEIMNAKAPRPPLTPSNKLFFRTQAVLWALYGNPGSSFVIRYIDGEGRERHAEVERGTRNNAVELYPDFPPVYLDHWTRILPGGIQYLRFNAFQPDDPRLLIAAIEGSEKEAPLILDLRGNNGGSAAATLALLARFSPQRMLAYLRQDRQGQEAVYVEPAGHVHSGAVAILVDELSVSAAENFAGILQQAGLATVFGKRTPGQLLWGEGFSLGDDVMAVIPVARIIHPNGKNLEGVGVTPDRAVELNPDDLLRGVDTQLRAAVDYLRLAPP